ncbi:hypothetical protein, partial [Micromonospora maritima]
AIVLYVESLNRPAAIAVPKYRPDCAAAAPSVLAAAFADGITTATAAVVTTPTTPASSALTAGDRRRLFPPRGTDGLIATLASSLAHTQVVGSADDRTPWSKIDQSQCLHRASVRDNRFRKSFGNVCAGSGRCRASGGAAWSAIRIR